MTTGSYRERLRCPWSWYAIGSIAAVLIALEVAVVVPMIPWFVVAGVTTVGACVIVAWIGRSSIVVADRALQVKGARLGLEYVEAVAVLDARTMRRLLGRDGDPAAFLATKPWIGPGIQVLLADPDDPVPYWVVGSRHPRELAEALIGRTIRTTPSEPGGPL